MNEITIFQNAQFGNVRVAMNESNEPLFCLADVCKAVELTNPSSVKGRLDSDEMQLIDLHALNSKEAIAGNSFATFITESGFYEVLLFSSSKSVKPFRKWVTRDIMPSIRKHGAYMTGETLAKMLQNPDSLIELLTALKSEQERNATLSIQNAMNIQNIEAMKPKAVYYDIVLQSDTLIPVDIIAARLGISAIKLNKFLCELGIQYKRGDAYVLGSNMRGKGFEGYKTHYYNDSNTGKVKTKQHMYWTEKGANFIINFYKSITSKTLN